MHYFNNLNDSSFKGRFIGNLNGVIIGEEAKNENFKDKIKYCVITLGFIKEEFISYINRLRKQKDPRPFVNTIPLVPYIYYTRYPEKEIIESVDLLHKTGLIKLTVL